MRFRKVLTSIGTLSKQKSYNFDVTPEQKSEALKRDFNNPLLIASEGSVLALYGEKGELRINFFISYYGFKEGPGVHAINQSGGDWITCKCGAVFRESKRISARQRFDQHIKEIQEEFKEETQDGE